MQLLEKPMHGCSMGVPGFEDYCNSRGEVGEGEVGVAATKLRNHGKSGSRRWPSIRLANALSRDPVRSDANATATLN